MNIIEIPEINKTIKKKIRSDIRNYNNQQIKAILEEGKSIKTIMKSAVQGKSVINKLIDDNNITIIQKDQIIEVTEQYYKTLYDTKMEPPSGKTEENRKIVKNVGSEKLPNITEEIAGSLKKLRNARTSGEDNIVAEMLKYGGEPILKLLEELYNR